MLTPYILPIGVSVPMRAGLEAQLHLIKEVGYERYLSQQIDEAGE